MHDAFPIWLQAYGIVLRNFLPGLCAAGLLSLGLVRAFRIK